MIGSCDRDDRPLDRTVAQVRPHLTTTTKINSVNKRGRRAGRHPHISVDAGHATIEVVDQRQAQFIDRVEVGRRVAGHGREVADTAATTTASLRGAEAEVIAEPVRTPGARSTRASLRPTGCS